MSSRTVASLSHILAIAKRLHQLVARFGVLSEAKAPFSDALRPAKVRQRWRYDVKSDTIAAVAQRLEHFGHFDITSRPSMDKEERNRIGTL